MSAMSCFLCRCNVGEGHMKTKRKRLSGSSVKRALEILDELSTANIGRMVSTLYTHDQHTAAEHAYICHKCQEKSRRTSRVPGED